MNPEIHVASGSGLDGSGEGAGLPLALTNVWAVVAFDWIDLTFIAAS